MATSTPAPTSTPVVDVPLFSVRNHHGESCGVPEFVNGDRDGCYHSYFENEDGEQALFVFEYATRTGHVVLGDAGWDTRYPVVNGFPQGGLVLGNAESMWLICCWTAATGEPFEDVLRKANAAAVRRARRFARRLPERAEPSQPPRPSAGRRSPR